MQGYPLDNDFSGFNNNTRRSVEGAELSYKDHQDAKYRTYQTANYFGDNDRKKYINSLGHLGMSASGNKDGYGTYVDTESNLKQSSITHPKLRQQLATRPFKGWPYMGAGETHIVNPNLYSQLVNGTETRVKKAADALAGVSVDRFIPLVPCLASNVQNTNHIIPKLWVRGGESSRAHIQNVDYYKMCGVKK